MTINPLNDISRVYLEQVAESAVPGKPAERLGAVTLIPKVEQEAARQRILAKAAAMRAKKGVTQEAKEVKRWWDDDGDDIGYEKGEVSGKFKKKKKNNDVNEGFSNWREDLKEIVEVSEKKNESKKTALKEKDVDNYSGKDKCVTIGPDIKEEIKILECIEIGEEYIEEKAESEQQQKLFGLALSVKRGETPRSEASDEVLKIVDGMSEKEIRKFAKTKHKGIPKKVEEELQPTTPQQIAAQQQLMTAQKKVTLANQQKLKKQKTTNEPIEEAQQRIKKPAQYANPRGTLDTTGIGVYPRTQEERTKMKKGQKVQPYPPLKRRRNNNTNDENPPRKRYRDDHPSLTARERNPNLR